MARGDKPGSPQLTSPARASPSRPRASPALREIKDSKENSRSSPATRDSRSLKDHRDQRVGVTARKDSRDVDGISKSNPAVEKLPVMRDSRANRENSFGNGLEDDLDVSPSEDEEEPMPTAAAASANSEPSNPASRFSNSLPPPSSRLSSPAVNSSPASLKRRPSLIIEIKFDRLGKTFAQFQNRLGRLQQAAR